MLSQCGSCNRNLTEKEVKFCIDNKMELQCYFCLHDLVEMLGPSGVLPKELEKLPDANFFDRKLDEVTSTEDLNKKNETNTDKKTKPMIDQSEMNPFDELRKLISGESDQNEPDEKEVAFYEIAKKNKTSIYAYGTGIDHNKREDSFILFSIPEEIIDPKIRELIKRSLYNNYTLIMNMLIFAKLDVKTMNLLLSMKSPTNPFSGLFGDGQ